MLLVLVRVVLVRVVPVRVVPGFVLGFVLVLALLLSVAK